MKAFQGRKVGIVENGTWAPSAGKAMKELLGQMKDTTLVEPVVTLRSAMKESDIPALEALAEAVLAE